MSQVSEYITQAVDLFIESDPKVKTEIASLTEQDAENYGASLDQLQRDTAGHLFEEYAQSKNMNHVDLALQMTVPSSERRLGIMRDYHRLHADALGMSWEDYSAIHSGLNLEWAD